MQSSLMPKIAGLLNIIAGSVGILGSLIAAILFYFVNNPQNNPESLESKLGDPVGWSLIILFFIINVIAIIGGVFALKRKIWGVALAGAIASILSIWGWILGIISIVLLILSKNEYRNALNED